MCFIMGEEKAIENSIVWLVEGYRLTMSVTTKNHCVRKKGSSIHNVITGYFTGPSFHPFPSNYHFHLFQDGDWITTKILIVCLL